MRGSAARVDRLHMAGSGMIEDDPVGRHQRGVMMTGGGYDDPIRGIAMKTDQPPELSPLPRHVLVVEDDAILGLTIEQALLEQQALETMMAASTPKSAPPSESPADDLPF